MSVPTCFQGIAEFVGAERAPEPKPARPARAAAQKVRPKDELAWLLPEAELGADECLPGFLDAGGAVADPDVVESLWAELDARSRRARCRPKRVHSRRSPVRDQAVA